MAVDEGLSCLQQWAVQGHAVAEALRHQLQVVRC